MTTSIETITPEIAKTYLSLNKGNRPVRDNRVQYYADQMTKGQWMLNGSSIIFNEDGDLLDGQHRLQAVIRSGVTIETVVCRNVENAVFTTIDNGLARQVCDTFSLSGIPNAALVSSVVRRCYFLTQKSPEKITTANTNIRAGFSFRDLLNEYNKHPDDYQDITRYARCLVDCRKLYGSAEIGGTIAYLFLYKGYGWNQIATFFDFLFEYREHAETKEPNVCKLLRERIVRSSLQSEKLSVTYKTRLLVKAWNCYITGKNVKTLRLEENDNTELI